MQLFKKRRVILFSWKLSVCNQFLQKNPFLFSFWIEHVGIFLFKPSVIVASGFLAGIWRSPCIHSKLRTPCILITCAPKNAYKFMLWIADQAAQTADLI